MQLLSQPLQPFQDMGMFFLIFQKKKKWLGELICLKSYTYLGAKEKLELNSSSV